ncbi:sister chromatid cohesion protein Dcc1 [Catenaria anguillulae PL171]|uniref:Sister chromatid cohesion protein Dcc1 n=1 Tax=Catenaria anguillulae PL171 TaxID=765915 RepID=A0A1Y2I2B2_9FUNG|nr:sister chromatid cohesion protein Dcc1 [Catenaria anguillulae PL171]
MTNSSTPSDPSGTVPIRFSATFAPNDSSIRYLELPPDLLALFESKSVGDLTLAFRGPKPGTHPDRNVTLHTDNATYLVREVQTSNTVLTCQATKTSEGEPELQVVYSSGNYLEVTHVPPPRLRETLRTVLVGTEWHDGRGVEFKHVTVRGLLREVQASEAELLNELKRIHAVEIFGYVRQLELDYVKDVLTLIVTTAVATDLDVNNLSVADMVDQLREDVNPAIVRHVMSECADERLVGDRVKLCATKVPAMYAQALLSPLGLGASMSLIDFEEQWQASVPEPFQCDHAQLTPFSLTVPFDPATNRPATIHYLPANELPGTIADRLRLLFSLRNQWPRDEIANLVRDLTLDGSDKACDQLLVKQAKMIKQGGQVLFGPRRDMSTLR